MDFTSGAKAQVFLAGSFVRVKTLTYQSTPFSCFIGREDIGRKSFGIKKCSLVPIFSEQRQNLRSEPVL
jgi:hypothetical protein